MSGGGAPCAQGRLLCGKRLADNALKKKRGVCRRRRHRTTTAS